jgi:hypothetical protein
MKTVDPRALPADTPRPQSRLLIWTSIWGGGIAWLVHLIAAWAAAEFGCLSGRGGSHAGGISMVAWLALGISLACLLLAAGAIGASLLCAKRSHGPTPEAADTTRFIAGYSLWANAIFAVIIVAQTIPIFFHLRDCGTHIAG